MSDSATAGSLRALLQVQEQNIEKIDAVGKDLEAISVSIQNTAGDLLELRSLVDSLSDLVAHKGPVPWTTTEKLAKRFDKDVATIRRWAREGRFPSYRLTPGGDLYFDENEVDQAVKAGRIHEAS